MVRMQLVIFFKPDFGQTADISAQSSIFNLKLMYAISEFRYIGKTVQPSQSI